MMRARLLQRISVGLEPRLLNPRAGIDGGRNRRNPLGHDKVQALDHSPFDGYDAFTGVFRLLEGLDDFVGP